MPGRSHRRRFGAPPATRQPLFTTGGELVDKASPQPYGTHFLSGYCAPSRTR